jgi:hypothetical protein
MPSIRLLAIVLLFAAPARAQDGTVQQFALGRFTFEAARQSTTRTWRTSPGAS